MLPYEDMDDPLHKDDLAVILDCPFYSLSPLKKLILWNPSTRQCNHIPCLSFVGYQNCMYSFFYDLDSDDYKIDVSTWMVYILMNECGDRVEMSPRVYGDIYHYGFGCPYRTYPPPSSPVPTTGHDATKGNTNNLVNDGNVNGNYGPKALRPSHQNSSFSSNGSYGRASLPTDVLSSGYQDPSNPRLRKVLWNPWQRCPDRVSGHTIGGRRNMGYGRLYPDRGARHMSSWGIRMELIRIALRAPSHQEKEFCPVDIPPSPDISHPDGIGGRFNFSDQTCPNPLIGYFTSGYLTVGWERRTFQLPRQSNSEEFSSKDERLGSSSLGVKKAGHEGKIATMARRLEELEMKKMQEVQAISQTPLQPMSCSICRSNEHLVEECPTIPVVREMFGDCNTYNSSWRDHPNFSWEPQPPQYQQPAQAPQQALNLDQAMVNLSKVMGDFVGAQKSINAHLSKRIDSVESSLNKKMDGGQNDLSQKIDNLQYSISRFANLNTMQEKGNFASQPHQNSKGIHEVEAKKGESSMVKEVKTTITLKSGKEVDLPTCKLKHKVESETEKEKREKIKGKKKGKSFWMIKIKRNVKRGERRKLGIKRSSKSKEKSRGYAMVSQPPILICENFVAAKPPFGTRVPLCSARTPI
ncbi:hypothetical protein CK203_015778 [Vitis vinifera]|uniref:Uncharacterized protein n=1 Tax=Vitis vinifera TaxID=29760 RepID=A0A438JRT3_VITVI|nr:hypothetical protein CK203_015778 [Vitis vinifera]